MIERGEEREARAFLNSKVAAAERKLATLSRELEAAEAELQVKNDAMTELKGGVEALQKEKDRLTREVDRVVRLKDQKEAEYFGLLAWLRSLPGIDMAASPTKIQQISLPDLTINYNFKEVPRYDRCTTCHQGIDRLGYQKDADGNPMTAGLRRAPVPPGRGDDRRPQGPGGHGGALPRRQRPAPDQRLRLHDLPRRPGLGDRFHLRLAHAGRPRTGRSSGSTITAGRRCTTGITRCTRSGSSSRAA